MSDANIRDHLLPVATSISSAEASGRPAPHVSTTTEAETQLDRINHDLGRFLQAKHISGLDALRAMAISLVLVDHFGVSEHLLGMHLNLGSFGVMIFFVLSGFLITRILLKDYKKTGSISFAEFYRRRAYRIFPTFYCCWILTTILECVLHQFYWKTAVVSFFYMMDYGRALAPGELQRYLHMWISWSLAVEEKFYFLWPLLLSSMLKKRWKPIPLLTVIILGQWTYRAVMYLVFHVSPGYLYHTFDMRVDALLVGCLLALLVEDDATRLRSCAVLRWQWLALLPPLAFTLMIAMPAGSRGSYLVLWSLQPLLAAVMLLQLVYWGAKSWTICASGIVKVTAQLSYALYLYHPLASQFAYTLPMRHLGFYAVGLTVPTAAASYYLVERPFLRLRDRRKPTLG